MPTPTDRLAALRDGGPHLLPRDPRRPRRERLDSDGLGLTVEYPSPLVLAETFARPVLEVDRVLYRDGSAIRAVIGDAATPVPLAALAADLRVALEALPDRDDAGRPTATFRSSSPSAAPPRSTPTSSTPSAPSAGATSSRSGGRPARSSPPPRPARRRRSAQTTAPVSSPTKKRPCAGG